MNEDRCVCCGEIIPEGRMVCPKCLVTARRLEMGKAYEAEMVFTASVGLKEINDIMHQFGCDGSLQIKDAIKIKLKQTFVSLPDEEYIRRVAEIIKTNYETERFNITDIQFDGYKYIREITV